MLNKASGLGTCPLKAETGMGAEWGHGWASEFFSGDLQVKAELSWEP
jgi:hypothetical protein